jgi:hypothetical protein
MCAACYGNQSSSGYKGTANGGDYFGNFDSLEKALNFDENIREESLIDWDALAQRTGETRIAEGGATSSTHISEIGRDAFGEVQEVARQTVEEGWRFNKMSAQKTSRCGT